MALILIVDDESAVRTIIRRTLEKAGHEVIEAADGEAALEMCGDRTVDLLVADLFMPVMDGLQLIVRFRDMSPSTRVVAISGSVYERRPRFLDVAQKMEFVVTLAKPFTPQELDAAVREALGS